MTRKILIVDDHEVVRLGLESLLSRHSEWEVVGEADSVDTAVRQAEKHQPDVVIMDIHFQNGSGIDACRKIRARHPETKVIMLTGDSRLSALSSLGQSLTMVAYSCAGARSDSATAIVIDSLWTSNPT